MTMALAHSRGWLVTKPRSHKYWPEFGRLGKERVPVRQLPGHLAGLFALDEPVTPALLGIWFAGCRAAP
jgi:hypothetical protein